MESLSSKEFFDKLKSNTLKPPWSLKGIVKKSDKDSEVLFTRKGDFNNWIKISSDMVESVNVLKSFSKEQETFTVVKLHLKAPSTPEGKVLYELLSSMEKEEEKSGWQHKSMGTCSGCGGKLHAEGEEHTGHHCGCGCHHCNCGACKCGCRCGNYQSCGCNCHNQEHYGAGGCGCHHGH